MSRMSKPKYLDPAYSIVKAFAGQDGKLGHGIDAVAAIAKRNRANVYRWMIPTERGGTGGFIPAPAQRALSEYARENRGPKWLREFLGGARAA